MNTEAIVFDRVALELGGASIYRDLSFNVQRSEFVCLLGPSGCGKSTSLRLMGDLLAAQSGTIRIEGDSPTLAWSRLAYVFQSPRLLPWKDALDNAAFGLEMRKPELTRGDRRERARQQLARVGLAADSHKMPIMLSGGERQRVAIARALALEPDIILMDEPFSALDPNTRVRLRHQLLDLWRETRNTIVFVTHDIDEALFLADRIIVMTPKPSVVTRIMSVSVDRPRDIENDPDLREQRRELLDLFEQMGADEGGTK